MLIVEAGPAPSVALTSRAVETAIARRAFLVTLRPRNASKHRWEFGVLLTARMSRFKDALGLLDLSAIGADILCALWELGSCSLLLALCIIPESEVQNAVIMLQRSGQFWAAATTKKTGSTSWWRWLLVLYVAQGS